MPPDDIASKLRTLLTPAGEPSPTATSTPAPTDDELAAALQKSTDAQARRRDARRALAECEVRLRQLLRGGPLSEGRELTVEGKISNALTAVVKAKDAV